ncbi:uncharacterized protein LOC141880862 isoform X5 [Acropora palmata]|uniref:uncharacterized protein LOC141880862 isoform X5 n=1 Tax=Acropora palmata TaxID=6131 RepID=UPI003DA06AAD
MKHPIVVNLLSFLALYLLSKAQASHFRHAILTWAPVNSYSNTLILRFRMAFRRSFSPSYNCDQSIINSGALRGSGGSWIARCRNSYCSSRTIADTGFQCTDFSVDEDWTMGEKNFTYTFASVSKEWVVSYQGCCWISSLVKYPDGNWLVTTTINLTRRSDTGRINSSPVSKSPAIIRFKEGCPQSFRIPVEDPDDDVVRCRWATYSESSRHTDSFPHGVIDERACLLQYNARRSGTAGTYAVALTLEDFPVGTTDFNSTTPFSAVGLQFLVIISARSGSCADVPLFTKATPTDGECTEVQIGLAYRAVIEVTLQDPSRRVTKIVTSSPVGMQLTPLRYDVSRGIFSRNITWYPSQYQVGQQLYCFKAVDSAGSESEWRCITILVGLSNTPRVVLGTRWPRYPSSQLGTGLMRLSIQFDRVIKKPRTSAYIRLVLLPSEHTVYKVDTLSRNVVISANKTELLFTLPKAALSMKGSYAILIDRGAVVGSGCSFDGPPTPGISSSQGWRFNVGGICSSGYYLDPPYYRTCTDVNECGSQSRKKRFAWWWPVTSIISIPFNSAFSAIATTTPAFSQVSTSTPGVSASAMIQLPPPGCSNHSYLEDSERRQGFYNGYDGYYQCDNNLAFGWYRFRGAAGTQMPTKCVGRNRCSTHAPGWLNASHPSVEDGIVTAKVCFHWTSGCCTWSTNIRVLNCGGFYVYELRPPPGCHLRYCGNGGSNQSTTTSSPQTSPTPAFYPAPTSTPGVSVSASPPFTSGSCGYNFTDRQGNLTSPNYPFSYPNNLSCLWTITATPGDFIYLYFTSFYVQGYYSWWHWHYDNYYYYYYGKYGQYGYNSNCPYDYVDIFDLNYPSSFIKVRGCGQQSPWCVKSKSHVMHIRFVTNSIYSYRGFTANYTVYRTPPIDDNCLSLNPYASSLTIFSATPISYASSSRIIQATPILSSASTSTSANNSMTTGSPQASPTPAFSPVPTSNRGSCRYNLVNPQGNFTSPNYPSRYPHNLNCLWTITAAPGYYIDLHFINFVVEGCPYDYVEVFDQNYPSTSIKVKSCGYRGAWCVTSTSKVLYVRFVTDRSVALSGFFASYRNDANPFSGRCTSLRATQIQATQRSSPIAMPISALHPTSSSTTGVPASASLPFPSGLCGYNFTARQGNLTSPNYPYSYPNNLNCLWTITTTPGNYIYLYFTYFYVQGYYYGYHGQYGYNSYCPYDYVEIFDLVYPLTSIKIKGCGYQSPWCVKSKSHVMHVRFVTDSFSSYRGFTAHYRVYTNPPAGGNCLSLNPYASSSGILQATPSMYTNTKYAFSNSTSTPVGIIYPTPASKRLPHYSSTVSQEKVPDFHLQLPADCEQVCHNTPGSYICSCVSGYQIASDGKSCSDINECSVNNGGCSHHCYNIPGAHYCGCPNGTTMTANNLTCVQPGVAVTCGKRNMTISLEKQSFSFVRAEEVHLRYSSCKATENGTHVTISTLLNDCGTSVNETQDALLFWNELRVDAMIIDGVITRSHDIRLPFYCSYSRKKLLSLSFNPLGVYYGQEAGYGNFTFKMDFFKSGSFLVPYSTADYPLQLRLNDYIYVRYSVESSADLVIMAENCRATKDGSFYSLPQYKIIQNGCQRGCLPGNRRKRRAVSRDGTEHLESTTKNTVSRGPLIFKDEVKQGGQGKKVGTLIGGVAGVGGVCILAFAALGILFVKYRLARRLMNRNKVGDLYATQNEMGRKGAYIQEDDINSKEDSL